MRPRRGNPHRRLRARQGVSASKGDGEVRGKSCASFYAIVRNLIQGHWYWHIKTNCHYELMNNQASMLQFFQNKWSSITFVNISLQLVALWN